ncbi:MAG: hypothetical protein ACRD1R_01005 [Acidobacteriota bacterium]
MGVFSKLFLWPALLLSGSVFAEADTDRICLIVTGLGGMPEYEENFVSWAATTEEIFNEGLAGVVHNLDGRKQSRDEILATFKQAASNLSPRGELWIFLIGHANFDGNHYKFNIRGPDMTDEDLGVFFDSLGSKRIYAILATSAAGAVLPDLSAPNRVIVTATRSASERQPPMFLSFFLEAAQSAEADRDKNGRVSILEAFLFSRQRVAGWFEEKKRIQTEHALLDDRGTLQLGARSSGENGEESANLNTGEGLLSSLGYLSMPPERAYATLEARTLAERKVSLEREIEDLKFRKGQIPEAEYYQQLEKLLVELAGINQQLSTLEGT